jgi:hypothetical protein
MLFVRTLTKSIFALILHAPAEFAASARLKIPHSQRPNTSTAKLIYKDENQNYQGSIPELSTVIIGLLTVHNEIILVAYGRYPSSIRKYATSIRKYESSHPKVCQ